MANKAGILTRSIWLGATPEYFALFIEPPFGVDEPIAYPRVEIPPVGSGTLPNGVAAYGYHQSSFGWNDLDREAQFQQHAKELAARIGTKVVDIAIPAIDAQTLHAMHAVQILPKVPENHWTKRLPPL